MNKEQILQTLKELITQLKNNSKAFIDDENILQEWQKKQQEVGIAVKKLNSCDALWLNDEYAKWFNSEIKPNLPDIDPSIKDKLIWK
jgi:hypothetical protein